MITVCASLASRPFFLIARMNAVTSSSFGTPLCELNSDIHTSYTAARLLWLAVSCTRTT